MKRVLVAGASGRLGREVVRRLGEEGHGVRALTRRPERLTARPDEVVRADLLVSDSLVGSCARIDAVISCAGASLDLRSVRERTSYERVDFQGNRNLLSVAEAEGVERFIYVSTFSTPELSRTDYVRAHERFAEELRRSPVRGVVVRPTGFFYVFAELLALASRGHGLVIGTGRAQTNPIHEADVAELCVAALEGEEGEIAAGGPHVYTRQQVVELAFEVLAREGRVRRVPPWAFNAVATLMAPLNPRIAELLRFGVRASVLDLVAPVRGGRDLRTYFEELVRDGGAAV